MVITATELKTNLGKYLEAVQNEDIIITKNNKVIATLTQPQYTKIAALRNIVGIAFSEEDIDLDKIKSERLKKQ